MPSVMTNRNGHKHRMEYLFLKSNLEPSVLELERMMQVRSQLSVADVVGVLEDENGIFVDRATLLLWIQTAR